MGATGPPRRLAEIALALTSVVVIFGLAEGTLRFAGYGAEAPPPGPMYVRSASRGYDLKPGYRSEGERSPYLVHPPIAINRLGLRGADVEAAKPPGAFRILCLGDSYIFGWGVKPEETFGARLEAALQEMAPAALRGRKVETLNAGVPAYGPAQELDLLREKGMPLAPDLVVLGFVLNDALPGGDRRPRLALPFKGALAHSALYRFLGRLYQQGLIVAVAEAAPDSEKIQDLIAYERSNTVTLESGLPDVEEARRGAVERILQMSEECRERGVPFLVVIFPNKYQVEDPSYLRARFNERLASELTSSAVPVLDLYGPYKAASGQAGLFLADTHPSPAGHEIAARIAARSVAEMFECGEKIR